MIPYCLTLDVGGVQFDRLYSGKLKRLTLKENGWLTERLNEQYYEFIKITDGVRFTSLSFVAWFEDWHKFGKKIIITIGHTLAKKPLGFTAYDPALFIFKAPVLMCSKPKLLTLNVGGDQFDSLYSGELKTLTLKENGWLKERLLTEYDFIKIADGVRFTSLSFLARFQNWQKVEENIIITIGRTLAKKPLGFEAYDPALFKRVVSKPERTNVDEEWGVPKCPILNLHKDAFEVMVTGEKKMEYRECIPKYKGKMGHHYLFIKFINGYHPNNPAFIVLYLGAEEQENVDVRFSNGLHVKMDRAIVFKFGEIIAYRFVPGRVHTHYTNETFGMPLVKVNTGVRTDSSPKLVAQRKMELRKTANDVISSLSADMMLYENIYMLRAACSVRRTNNIKIDMRLMAKEVLDIGGKEGAEMVLAFFNRQRRSQSSNDVSLPQSSSDVSLPQSKVRHMKRRSQSMNDVTDESSGIELKEVDMTELEEKQKRRDENMRKQYERTKKQNEASRLLRLANAAKYAEKKRLLLEKARLRKLGGVNDDQEAETIIDEFSHLNPKLPQSQNEAQPEIVIGESSRQERRNVDRSGLVEKQIRLAEIKRTRAENLIKLREIKRLKKQTNADEISEVGQGANDDEWKAGDKRKAEDTLEEVDGENIGQSEAVVEEDDGFGAIGGHSISGGSFGLDGSFRRLKRVLILVTIIAICAICIIIGLSIGLATRK